MDCIILAGGKGLRMGVDIPKPLTPVLGKELISYQIDYLKDKVRKIIVALGHHADEVEEFILDTYPELAIVCVRERELLGTAGAIRNCLPEVETERFLVVNGDDLCDIDIKFLEDNTKGDVICVHNPTSRFGIIQKNEDGSNALGRYSFIEKPMLKGLWTSCGWYVLSKETAKFFPIRGSVEYNVFPRIDFDVHKHLGEWYTFNSHKDVDDFEAKFRS